MRQGGLLSWRVALCKTTTHTPQWSAPMVDMVALLHCTRPHVTTTTIHQLSRIIVGVVFLSLVPQIAGISTFIPIMRFFGTPCSGCAATTTQSSVSAELTQAIQA